MNLEWALWASELQCYITNDSLQVLQTDKMEELKFFIILNEGCTVHTI